MAELLNEQRTTVRSLPSSTFATRAEAAFEAASAAAPGEVLLVVLGRLGQLRSAVEDGLHLLLRLLAFGGDVLGGPVAGVRAVLLQDPPGDGGQVHLVDTVGYAHGGRRRVHGLDGGEVGRAQRA